MNSLDSSSSVNFFVVADDVTSSAKSKSDRSSFLCPMILFFIDAANKAADWAKDTVNHLEMFLA